MTGSALNYAGDLTPAEATDREGVGFTDGWQGNPSAYMAGDPDYLTGYRRGTVARYASGGNMEFDALWKIMHEPMIPPTSKDKRWKNAKHLLRTDRLELIMELALEQKEYARLLWPNEYYQNVKTALDLLTVVVAEFQQAIKENRANGTGPTKLPKSKVPATVPKAKSTTAAKKEAKKK